MFCLSGSEGCSLSPMGKNHTTNSWSYSVSILSVWDNDPVWNSFFRFQLPIREEIDWNVGRFIRDMCSIKERLYDDPERLSGNMA